MRVSAVMMIAASVLTLPEPCGLASPNSPPTVRVDGGPAKPPPPAPQEDRDPCKNIWVYADGTYHNGYLRHCEGSAPMSGGSVGGWMGGGPWPPPDPPFITCPQGTALEIVVPKLPPGPIHMWLYEWKDGMTFTDKPRELQHSTYPPSLRTQWPCVVGQGRYLLTVGVQRPGVATERSFGIEVK